MSCHNTFSDPDSTSPGPIFFFLTRDIFYQFPIMFLVNFKTIIILFNNGGFYGRTKMQKELEHLLAEVHWIQQKLKNLPEENISCERDKQYIRWYLISEGKRNYLPRSQEKLANKLMQKNTISPV